MKPAICVAVALVLLQEASPPAYATSATTTITLEVVQPAGITLDNGMDFGDLTAPTNGQASTFALACNGAVTTSGTGNGSYLNGGGAAEFAVHGSANSSFLISASLSQFSNSNLTLANAMISANPGGVYNSGATCDTQSKTVTADASGYAIARIGASLTVGSGTATGTYSDAVVTITVTQQ